MLKPDTLDLVERAKLSLNYLTSMVDSKLNYLPYTWGAFYDDPPHADHHRADSAELVGSWTDALISVRQMTGSKEGIKVEKALKDLLLSCFKEKGLRYNIPYPWSPELYSDMHEQGWILNGLVSWYLETKEDKTRRTIDKLAKALLNISVRKSANMGIGSGIPIPEGPVGNYCYFPHEIYTKNGWEVTSNSSILLSSAPILPLVRYYEETGNEDAFTLAEGLANYLVNRSKRFDYNGRFIGHFWPGMWVVGGVLRYGLASERKEAIEWAKKVYNWALNQGSTFGWFPEWVGVRRIKGCETCCIYIMIYIGIMLAKAGWEKYWNDVERFVRNQLVENQLSSKGQIKVSRIKKRDTKKSTYDNLRERAIGGFWGFTLPNDSNSHDPSCVLAGCCGANGAKALFLVWDSIVEKKPEGVYVNLAFNRESPQVEVISYRPYEGKVKLIIHDAPILFVRIPQWAARERVSVYLDNRPQIVQWKGDYIKLEGLAKDQKVSVTYPLRKEQKTEVVANQEYKVNWRGDTVVGISPQGKVDPLYERDYMDTNKVPLKEKEKLTLTEIKVHW